MKKNIRSVFNIKTISAAFLLGFILLLSACNKNFDNVLPKSFRNDTLGLGSNSKKVLYIILDGVKGSVVSSLAPANITQITNNAIFSYDGVADYQRNSLTNAAAWTTMLTGVDYTKHNVSTEAFTGLNLQTTPTLFTGIKSNLGNVRTVSLASTAAFNDNLAVDATVKQTLADDAAVKTSVIAELGANNPSLLVAQFHSAEVAGLANGYTASTTAYTTAINTLDGYVGEILTALRARKTYAQENWLVVVSSNKGGAATSGGAPGSNIYADDSRNTFVAFYNPKFKPNAINKPDVSNLPYSGIGAKFNATNGAVQSDANFLNLGTNIEATIRFNIRWDGSAGNSGYCAILQKRGLTSGITGGVPGWAFIKDDGGIISLNTSFTGSGNIQAKGPTSQKLDDGKWHAIAVRFYNSGADRYASMFVDGIPAQQPDLKINGNINSIAPLQFGKYSSVDCFITEFAVYNIAIPKADIIAASKKTPLTPISDPYYNNLIAYYKTSEGVGNVLNDALGKSPAMNLVGTPNWTNYADISPNLSPAISEAAFKAVPNGVDIPVLIYNWLNIAAPAKWALMGKFYAPVVSFPTN
ncbi:LamG-like jellyroll fold domain-containing protein [Pedobacter ghigonis]|uniref:LamG-like jellyroll fold domain-containing protein n=1 Tax=Pedobacter ghigonis TaxID=2730403 RepID=UPI00158B99DA|nr:LamG-like jellyroll fold domain-containing protein [Pedobacter ghigonis]